MSRYIQKTIKNHIKKILETQNKKAYSKCQDNIEALINFMYSIGGNTSELVELLELHYRLLFQISTGEIGLKPLKENLSNILDEVNKKNDPNRIEAVFISSKADMSDSIESIYLAAKDDPDCDAYWIPAPYFDVNEHKQAVVMHCESEGYYSDEIKITRWEEYDIEARRPDIIFTFSAYDNLNNISVIHSDFYSSRLCNLTDLLVFVPYYVDVDYGTADVFSLSQSCIHAHKTILATEKMKEHYKNVFMQEYGDRFGNPEEKFIALGSPKYDKVKSTKRENCDLPQNWRDLIGDKKVITYISSVGSVLETTDTYMDKLRTILDTFKSYDNILLWWRPHPLIKKTIKRMRSDILQQYNDIVDKYKNEGWGIYDDSSDLHRAIAWSDGFYGDWSSVLLMFQHAGKPAMLADTTIRLEHLKPGLGSCRYDRESDSLTCFIDDIIKGNHPVSIHNEAMEILNAEGTAGKAIYEYAKNIVLSKV